jgi:hypothetical protein
MILKDCWQIDRQKSTDIYNIKKSQQQTVKITYRGGFRPEIYATNKSIIGQNPPSSARAGKIDSFPNLAS